MDEFLAQLREIIPEASYDLIGRLLPGGIVVAVAWPDLPSQGPSFAARTDWFEPVAFFSFAYAAGLVISSFAHLIHRMAWSRIVFPSLGARMVESFQGTLRKALGAKADVALDRKYRNATIFLDHAHDYIKREAREERPVVIKLMAEVSLLYSLSIATVISFFVVLFACRGVRWQWLLVSLAFLVAGLIRSVRVWSRHSSILAAIVARH